MLPSHLLALISAELGLGRDVGKSATKPQQIMPLDGVDVIECVEPFRLCGSKLISPSVAAGAFCTFFLARPNDKLSDIPRYPLEIPSSSICLICNVDRGPDDFLLECEKANSVRFQIALQR